MKKDNKAPSHFFIYLDNLTMKWLVVICVSALFIKPSTAIFYTNSKQNDYPRLGRRSGDPGNVLPESESFNVRRSPVELILSKLHSDPDIIESVKQFFDSWDVNGDGMLSKPEVTVMYLRRKYGYDFEK